MKRSVRKIIPYLISFGVMLGVYRGQLALWKGDDPQPCKIFPCPVSMLPRDQRQALEKGIKIDSMEDLDRLLEAYLS